MICNDCGEDHGGAFCPADIEEHIRYRKDIEDRRADHAPASEVRWSSVPPPPLIPHPWAP